MLMLVLVLALMLTLLSMQASGSWLKLGFNLPRHGVMTLGPCIMFIRLHPAFKKHVLREIMFPATLHVLYIHFEISW